jgi:hypothetical protein
MRRIFQVAGFLFVVALRVAAQSTAPDIGIGQMVPPTLPSEHNKNNMFTASLAVTNLYDDNFLSTQDSKLGNFNWFVQPQIAVAGTRPHIDWALNYSPTVMIDRRFGVNDLLAHNFGLDVKYRPTRHVTVGIYGSLRVETSLLDRVTQHPSTPEFGVLDRPNDLVLPPVDRRTYEQAGVDVNYLVGRFTIIGIGGNFAQSRFRNLPNQAPITGSLVDSQIEGGRLFFSHRLTRRHSVGAVYQLHSFLFQGGEARAITHSILYMQSIALTPRTSLSFFVGPEFSRIRNQILLTLNLFPLIGQFTINTLSTPTSLSGGATYQWGGDRTTLLGTVVSRVSDGGGLFGASRLQAATGEIRRQLAPRWRADVGLSYGRTSALGLSPSNPSFPSSTILLGTSSLTWSLAQHVAVEFRYARLNQVGYGTSASFNPGDHNLFYASLTYQFARPLGR